VRFTKKDAGFILALAEKRSNKTRKGRGIMDLEGLSKDVLLFCYVDSELGLEQKLLVEDLLSRDPDAFQRVEEIRDLNRLLKAAYNEYGRAHLTP
jgi:hypothetical protein